MQRAIVYSFQTGEPIESGKPVESVVSEEPVKRKRRLRWDRIWFALAVLSIFVYGMYSFVTDAWSVIHPWIQKQQHQTFMEDIFRYEPVVITIKNGETAWSIQRELTPNERDIRHPLYLAEKLNSGVTMGELNPGQTVVMLKERPSLY